MRPLLHLLSFGLLLPGLLFASGVILLGRAIAGVTLWGLFERLLSDAVWLVSWGMYVIAALLLVILVGGFFIQSRWLAALCIAVLALVSLIVTLVGNGSMPSAGQWLFLLPGLVAFGISAWISYSEW